jgi:hypothetical protein
VPRIQFRCLPTHPPLPGFLAGAYPGWRAISGFEAWGGPYPERGLPRCRWVCGPVAEFELHSGADGPARLLIAYRSHYPRQRVRLVTDGRVLGQQVAPQGDGVLVYQVDLARGANRVQMHLWRWRTHGKPLALIVKSITVAPPGTPAARTASAESRAVAVEVK